MGRQSNDNKRVCIVICAEREKKKTMGAASIKGLVLMETVFPSPDGYTVFDDPQMKKQLVKELKKGTIKPPTASDELDIDEDIETKIDQVNILHRKMFFF